MAFEDDEDAIRATTEHGTGHFMELWQGDRLVKRFSLGETRRRGPLDGPL